MADYDQRIRGNSHSILSNRFTQNTTASNQASRTANTPHAQGMNFSRGQIIRGEIVDLRNHEIKVQLNNNQMLSGRIDDAVRLAIGEEATFQVTEATSSTISLKVMSDSMLPSEESTIDKALEAASLPKSDRNIAAVRALLSQGLSVDKTNIQNLLRQAVLQKGVSFQALAALQKHHLPINEVNASQADAYINHEHRIANLADQTATNLAETLQTEALDGNMELAKQINTEVLRLLINPADPQTLTSSDLSLSTLNLLSPEDTLALLDTFEKAGISSEQYAGLANGSATLRETASLILDTAERLLQPAEAESIPSEATGEPSAVGNSVNELLSSAQTVGETVSSGEQSISETPIAPAADSNAIANEAAKSAGTVSTGMTALFRSLFQSASQLFVGSDTGSEAPVSTQPIAFEQISLSEITEHFPEVLQTPEVIHLVQQFASVAQSSSELSALLPKSSRIELANSLKGKLPNTVLKKIESGELKANELMKLLLEAENNSSADNQDSAYLAEEAYRKLMEALLKEKLTMEPRDLQKPNALGDYYEELDKTLSSLEKLPTTSENEEQIYQTSSAGIRDNIDFMKTLNSVFSYIQLPMRLQDQAIHAELYVYTPKEQLKADSSSITALLHLDMEQLGPTDIHLSLNDRKLNVHFYLPDESSTTITDDNIRIFSSALERKGYAVDAKISQRNNTIDPIREFLAPENNNVSMKRYNFDIRA